jgi:hypothetical protein
MPFIPHTEADVAAMLASIGAPPPMRCSMKFPPS